MTIIDIRNDNLKALEEIKAARKTPNGIQPSRRPFKISAPPGVFIKTSRKLSIGQEIAITFTFPRTQQTIMANGEIVRITNDGAVVKIKMFFKE